MSARALLTPGMVLLHLAALVSVSAAAWLGWWQVEAWRDHREDRASALAEADPVPLDEAIGPDDAFPAGAVGRPVEVAGRWLPGVLHVSDRRRTSAAGSEEGFWQVGLVEVCAPCGSSTGAAVPVVLGWSADAESEPVAGAPGRPVDLTGWLQPSEAGEDVPGTARGDVVPVLRTADLLDRVPGDVYSAYVILRGPADLRGDLVPVTPDDLPPPPATTALRNLFYGVQWWIFGGFAVFLWSQWCRDAVRGGRRPGRDGSGEPIASGA